MLKNDLLLRVAAGEKTERPPVWLMRQAGRILPQYRAIRNKLSGFKELVETPELACEVTIQPVDELGVDAAIIFSDILVIPEAMGLPYEMVESKGPVFPRVIESAKDVEDLGSGASAASELEYVYQALALTKKELNDRVPLIGFAGAPFTLLCYMLEGKGSKTFSKAKKMLYKEPEVAHALLEKITLTTIAYLKNKAKAGADLIQIFDSWAGALSKHSFETFSLPYIERIASALQAEGVPVTIFAKGAWYSLSEIAASSCNVVGLDWTVPAAQAREQLGVKQVVQGNLDPCALYSKPEDLRKEVTEMLKAIGPHHIANLGHGVYPDTPLDNVKVFVEAVQAYRY